MAAKLAGSGGGKYSLGQNSEINVTPFVDVLLVLLIIFMVAVPMATVSIKVDLSKERVMIRADAEVPYSRFMDVINQFQTAGFYQVGLINEDIS